MASKPTHGLNARQLLFCTEYVKHLNASKAAVDAGYSEKTADQTASRLLRNVKISKYVSSIKGKQLNNNLVTAEKIIKELATLGFASIKDFLNIDVDGNVTIKELAEMTNAGAIKSIKVQRLTNDGMDYGSITEIRFHDKIKALELLGKHLAIFTDNQGNGDTTNVTQIVNNIMINHRAKGDQTKKQAAIPIEIKNVK